MSYNRDSDEALGKNLTVNSGAQRPVEPVVMVPYLKNRADGVDGRYCIARLHQRGYHEFWNDEHKKWCSAGSVFELGKAP